MACTYTCITSPTSNVPQQRGVLVTIDEPITTHHYHPKFSFRFTLGVHSMDLDKCIMLCIHHYYIRWSIFTSLKVLSALPVHPALSKSLAISNLFTVSLVLPFPECHIVRIIQYAAFLFKFLVCLFMA